MLSGCPGNRIYWVGWCQLRNDRLPLEMSMNWREEKSEYILNGWLSM